LDLRGIGLIFDDELSSLFVQPLFVRLCGLVLLPELRDGRGGPGNMLAPVGVQCRLLYCFLCAQKFRREILLVVLELSPLLADGLQKVSPRFEHFSQDGGLIFDDGDHRYRLSCLSSSFVFHLKSD